MLPPQIPFDTSDADAQLAREQAQNASRQSFSGDVGAAVKKFPALAKVAGNVVVVDKEDPGDGRQLESYPPWERDNPNPGKFTTEVYNQKAKGDERTSLVAGDMLHYLGAIDPNTGKPIDPQYRAMKEQFLASMTPEQTARNKQVYAQARSRNWNGTFEQFMDFTWGDAYIRGWITPDRDDHWRKDNVYTPQQKQILERMKAYLERGN